MKTSKQLLTSAARIRSGVVELRTHIGWVYASPTFWERIYLLWTFRNFHSLPTQVLNRHERQLIDKLCRTAIVSRNGPVARTSIIGTVENVKLAADCREEAAASKSKLVTMSASDENVTTSRAVGYKGIAIRSNRIAQIRTVVGRFRRQSGNVQCISAPKQDFIEQSQTKEANPTHAGSDAGKGWNQAKLRWALVVTAGGALLGTLFYSEEAHISSSRIIPSAASAARAQPGKVQQSTPAELTKRTTTIALEPTSPAVSFTQLEISHPKAVIFARPPVRAVDSSPAVRLQVAEPPMSGFSYPNAPNPTLRGRVSLKAVIGADGTVTEVDVLSGNRALLGAAVQAVRHWRYRTHELKGNAVEAETNIVISFVGDDAVSITFPTAQ